MTQSQLPADQLERVWSKLTVAYGRFFLGQWDGIPTEAVREDWAEELAAFAGKPWAIEYALQHRPERTPLTAAMFRRLCGQAPAPLPAAESRPPVDPRRAAEVLGGVAAAQRYKDPKQWARDLLRQELRGRLLGRYQRSAWRNALGYDDGVTAEQAAAALGVGH